MHDPAAAAEKDVHAALQTLRQALLHYRKVTGKPPLFLLEKRAPELDPQAISGCQVFATRHQMLRVLLNGGNGGEVGVQHGHFSRFLLDEIKPESLHLFDMSDRLLRDDVRADPRTVLQLGDSSTQLLRQPDHSFDWLYIDGDHSYDGVLRDAKAALQKIRPGGTLIFNDYTPWSPGEAMAYGVMACVNELANQGLQMTGLALTSNGYFDVALRVPAA